jgi:hypothetical protein
VSVLQVGVLSVKNSHPSYQAVNDDETCANELFIKVTSDDDT